MFRGPLVSAAGVANAEMIVASWVHHVAGWQLC